MEFARSYTYASALKSSQTASIELRWVLYLFRQITTFHSDASSYLNSVLTEQLLTQLVAVCFLTYSNAYWRWHLLHTSLKRLVQPVPCRKIEFRKKRNMFWLARDGTHPPSPNVCPQKSTARQSNVTRRTTFFSLCALCSWTELVGGRQQRRPRRRQCIGRNRVHLDGAGSTVSTASSGGWRTGRLTLGWSLAPTALHGPPSYRDHSSIPRAPIPSWRLRTLHTSVPAAAARRIHGLRCRTGCFVLWTVNYRAYARACEVCVGARRCQWKTSRLLHSILQVHCKNDARWMCTCYLSCFGRFRDDFCFVS